MLRFISACIMISLMVVNGAQAGSFHSNYTPHVAIYKLKLGKVKSGSGVQNVSGTLTSKTYDSCKGLSSELRMNLLFETTDGAILKSDSTDIMWERADGKKATFYSKSKVNGHVVESDTVKGKMMMTKDGGIIHFELPKEKADIKIPKGVFLPIAFDMNLIQKAKEGKRLVTGKLFDAEMETGYADVTAFIGNQKEKEERDFIEDSDSILKGKIWPVRLAVYDPREKGSLPNVEGSAEYQEDGVAHNMEIELDSFSLIATLEKIEGTTPVSGCIDTINE